MLLSTMSIGDALITGAVGYGVVFLGLVTLMLVILVMGKVMTRSQKTPSPVQEAAPAPAAKVAPGTAGEIKLHNVSDREAAMIMAIVADKMGRPLNELRFKSIKEVQ